MIVRKLKGLEAENAKLKRLVAEQLLVIDGLREFAEKMRSPADRCAAMALLTGRGLSARAASRDLDLSCRLAEYRLRAPAKDGSIDMGLVFLGLLVGH